MKRLVPSSIAIAALIGVMAFTEIAEAGKIRSPIERRLRPGRGFWDNGSPSQVRSYNGYSNGTQQYYTPQQQYAAPQQQYAPQQYVMPQQQYSPYRYYVQPRYVQPPTYVQQPRTVVPAQTGTPAAKPSQVSPDSQTGE